MKMRVLWKYIQFSTDLKVSVSRDFRPPFFEDSNPSGLLINRLKYFRIWFRFCRYIRSQNSISISTPRWDVQ